MTNNNDLNQNVEYPRLYHDLASWFPILTAPEDYKEEAEFYRQTIISACKNHRKP